MLYSHWLGLAAWELAVTQSAAENTVLLILYTCAHVRANDHRNVNLVIIIPALTFLCSDRW